MEVELLLLLLLLLHGAAEAGASPLVSMATGKASTVRGGTVETGELHSVLEPLRRASRCRFLYSSKETWENSGRQRSRVLFSASRGQQNHFDHVDVC